ncbi:hypothetical protein [Nisaea denitrificans]|uniref:hypothetical protein n=1 Tax=Nisaea denitrificans TaxID=390877 RepID=UPI0012EB2DCF|nr:hypothetical protein [Nisaea denitrificans]
MSDFPSLKKKTRNSSTLLAVLEELIAYKFDGNKSEASKHLENYVYEGRHTPSLRREVITKVLQNDQHLKYVHLETFSNSINVPSAALLLLSRVRSEKEKHNNDMAIEILNRMISYCESAKKLNKEKLTVEHLVTYFSDLGSDNQKKRGATADQDNLF